MPSRAGLAMTQPEKDADLEARIFTAYCQAVCKGTTESWAKVNELIGQRSPQQVWRMEVDRGLV